MELLILAFFVFIILRLHKNGKFKDVMTELITPRQNYKNERIASDGHKIPAKDDISCARFGHHHEKTNDPEFPEAQFIVHNEPVEGYINLNGKILKRSEADEYMKRHGG